MAFNKTTRVKRLYVCEYEKVKEWTLNKNILKYIKPTDIILILKTKTENNLSSAMVKMLDDLEKKNNVTVVDVSTSDNPYEDDVVIEINKLLSDDTRNIIFLQMQDIYEEVKNDFSKYNVESKKNYILRETSKNESSNVRNKVIDDNVLAANNGSNNKEESSKNITNDNKKNSNKNNVQIKSVTKKTNENENSYSEKKSEKNNASQNDEKKDNNKAKGDKFVNLGNQQKKAQPPPQKQSSVNSSLFSSMASALQRSENIEKTNKQVNDRKNNKNEKSSVKEKKIISNDNTDIESLEDLLTVNDIEKMIFGSEAKNKEFIVEYSQLDNDKAALVGSLYDRLIDSINQIVPELSKYEERQDENDIGTDEDINKSLQNKYWNFVFTLIKSTDFIDFQASIEAIIPGLKLNMNEQSYTYLYDEACYYASVCKTLYDDDKWA